MRKQTSNTAVLGELGRFPISVLATERCLKYWCKIMKTPTNTVHSIFREQCDQMLNNENSWVHKIRNKLQHLGLGNIWTNHDININYNPQIQRRIRDHYIQGWQEQIHSSTRLEYYSKFKVNFELESYLINIKNDSLRKTHDLEHHPIV